METKKTNNKLYMFDKFRIKEKCCFETDRCMMEEPRNLWYYENQNGNYDYSNYISLLSQIADEELKEELKLGEEYEEKIQRLKDKEWENNNYDSDSSENDDESNNGYSSGFSDKSII